MGGDPALDKFDFILILLSFAFAMALGRLLASGGALLQARRRVRFSGLWLLAVLNALAQVFVDWLSLWDMRDLAVWNLFQIAVFFTYPIIVYFICVAATPETLEDGEIDLERFYWENRRVFYGLFALLMLTFIGAGGFLATAASPRLALQQSLSNLPFLAASLLGLFARARWAQWAAGLSLLILTIAWAVYFSGALT